MFSAIVGGILGAATGLYQGYQQKRALDRQERLAKQQFELQKQQMEQEEQARNKMNQKEVDIEGLLDDNTSYGLGETILSGANYFKQLKNPLNKKSGLLGG